MVIVKMKQCSILLGECEPRGKEGAKHHRAGALRLTMVCQWKGAKPICLS